MEPNPIMLITLSVAPEKEGEFNDFYQHKFLPGILASAPEVLSIRRYEEMNFGSSLRWYNKQYVTIYELANKDAIANADEIFQRKGMQDLTREFQSWKTNDLKHFSRISYTPRWEHQRIPVDGHFGSRPFLLWSLEMKPELDDQFQSWYETEYLPLQIADIPSFAACRRYSSVGREKVRHLTIFEAADETALQKALGGLRSLHRVAQNREWKRRLTPAVDWHDATSFSCIYRRPG
ncbi:hypothetical protein KF728_05820 [Candidatus Obscuribacterales bacterium]|nr:hypothetical protein [Candidatus Obscuribacterales bacterium]MBX3149660.1 hypothetical protein [Candidatus Obscuribacterales bacterium]